MQFVTTVLLLRAPTPQLSAPTVAYMVDDYNVASPITKDYLP